MNVVGKRVVKVKNFNNKVKPKVVLVYREDWS